MSRPIKFRAWDKKLNKWVDPEIVDLWAIYTLNESGVHIYSQFTGLLDKNGKEIYEGDIVMDPSEYGGKKVVQWNSSQARFEFDKFLGYMFDIGSVTKCEVIGNIYEP